MRTNQPTPPFGPPSRERASTANARHWIPSREGWRAAPGCVFASFIIALALRGSALPAQDYGADKPPPIAEISIPLTAEEKAQLHAVDVRIAGVETLAEKIDDAAYRKSVIASIADMKQRRAALAKKFDPGLYEALMHSVISRYQVVALWLTPPRVPPPSAKTAPDETRAATPNPPAPQKNKTDGKAGSP